MTTLNSWEGSIPVNEEKIKVLYIAGWGRSGSRILARTLSQVEGFFHGGELRTIWIDGLKPIIPSFQSHLNQQLLDYHIALERLYN